VSPVRDDSSEVLHHRRAAVNEVCPSTSSRQQRWLCSFASLRQRNRVFIMAAAALRHQRCQRKSGEMNASGRPHKRTGAWHKFPLYPLFIFCLLLEHIEKAKAKGKRRTPGLLSLCSTVLLRCLFLVKKSRRLRCFELGVRGCFCRWLIHLGSWGSQGGPALRASMFIHTRTRGGLPVTRWPHCGSWTRGDLAWHSWGPAVAHQAHTRTRRDSRVACELELELIKIHMTQKPLMWVEVGALAVRKKSECAGVARTCYGVPELTVSRSLHMWTVAHRNSREPGGYLRGPAVAHQNSRGFEGCVCLLNVAHWNSREPGGYSRGPAVAH
jgi:hypothetical protein